MSSLPELCRGAFMALLVLWVLAVSLLALRLDRDHLVLAPVVPSTPPVVAAEASDLSAALERARARIHRLEAELAARPALAATSTTTALSATPKQSPPTVAPTPRPPRATIAATAAPTPSATTRPSPPKSPVATLPLATPGRRAELAAAFNDALLRRLALDDTVCGLTRSLCEHNDERFVTYTQGGGFNNQRQSVQRTFQLAKLLNRTLIVRDVWTDPKHNPGFVPGVDSFVSFETMFDIEQMAKGVPVITEKDFMRRYRHLWEQRLYMRGVFKGDIHWTDTVPCDYENGNQLKSITGRELIPRSQLYGIREQLGCRETPVLELGIVGMNRFWRTSQDMRRFAAQYVRLSPRIRSDAALLKQALMDDNVDPLTARRAGPPISINDRPNSFVCIHYRQGDKLAVSPREYNYTAGLVADIITENKWIERGERVYVATDLPPERFELLQPFVDRFDARMLATSFASILAGFHAPSNDYVGAVEVELCTGSRLFFGSSSTFSGAIVGQRHRLTGMCDWEVDETRNFRITRLTREWKASHGMN